MKSSFGGDPCHRGLKLRAAVTARRVKHVAGQALRVDADEDVLAFADLSADAIGNTPAEMAAFMKKDAERWRDVIRSAGVKAD